MSLYSVPGRNGPEWLRYFQWGRPRFRGRRQRPLIFSRREIKVSDPNGRSLANSLSIALTLLVSSSSQRNDFQFFPLPISSPHRPLRVKMGLSVNSHLAAALDQRY